jgi:hypothetical protein
MKKIVFLFMLSITAIAQNPNSSKYIQISYFKANNYDFLDMELSIWKPVREKQIEMGDMEAWYLYKVKYPTGSNAPYDFVAVNVFTDWEQIGNKGQDYFRQIHGEEADDLLASSDEIGTEIWNQVFELMGQSIETEKQPSKFIKVNEVKLKPGETKEYINMELTYFKPYHAERVKTGVMNNWSFYRFLWPHGEKYPSDYVTFDGYSNWNDLMLESSSNAWKSIHGSLKYEEIQEKTSSKRTLVNSEIWELMDFKIAD